MRNLFLWSLLIARITAWREWNYSLTKTVSYDLWEEQWSRLSSEDTAYAPRPRRGHSLVVAGNYLVLFGGRGNEGQAVHIPRTYNVKKVNGTMIFTTYEDKPVSACHDLKNEYFTVEEQQALGCTGNETTVTVGLFYNDVWAYNLDCDRYFDGPCEGTGWTIWHPGALEGGCNIQLGIEVCNVPSERWNHGTAYFEDGTMYVYGGFSQRCADYCDDMWMFDIYMKAWRQVYAAGTLSRLPGFLDSYGNGGPGKRWRMSMVNEGPFMTIFGGHRLWHGYAPENSQDNDWKSNLTLPYGGYLNDLWVYVKELDFDTQNGADFHTTVGTWHKMEGKETCYHDPGIAWESRNKITCETVWPTERAGHTTALDTKRNLLWLFGGYRTYYPYLSTDGMGSDEGTGQKGSGGFVPYPSYTHYLNDMWYFNFTDGYWTEIQIPEGDPIPDGRVDHIMLITEQVLFIHGGTANNYLYDDVWYFDLTTHKWLEKKEFVYPFYPDSCTDDLEFIANNNCTHLSWPKHLQRDINYPFEILPFHEQPYYWPNLRYGMHWDIFNKGDRPGAGDLAFEDHPDTGTPLVPYAASGPLQYVSNYLYEFNSSHTGILYERCTSVFAEPTRGMIVDGQMGRSNGSVFIPQPRRRRPGWDGCRDRADGDELLPKQLQYIKPYARSSHRGVYVPATKEIIIYGGKAYLEEQPFTVSNTWDYKIAHDMWYFRFDICINNCSNHGVCKLGFCECFVGYYGVDCSNISCPGTSCYYDEDTHEQVCRHACQAGYNHTDNDVYVKDIRKTPCSRELPGESNGVCDGFGHAICAPPFIGDDCSIKDCKHNCSFNGWCSVEYPVSRCMCNPGYFGEYCEQKYCLNNCSYPNGVCNYTTGDCQCRMMYDPYNNSREFKPWAGEDCSYLHPYAAASTVKLTNELLGVLLLGAIVSQVVAAFAEEDKKEDCDVSDECEAREKGS